MFGMVTFILCFSFWKHYHKKHYNLTQRYIAELAKFRIAPTYVVFNCLELLLQGFSDTDVEVLCNMVECCGRWMVMNPATRERMEGLVCFLDFLRYDYGEGMFFSWLTQSLKQ